MGFARAQPMLRAGRKVLLPADRTPDGRDDAVLRGFVKIGVHRQADDLLGDEVGNRQPARVGRKMPVRLLAMERLWIIDRRWNALRLEGPGEGVPASGPD